MTEYSQNVLETFVKSFTCNKPSDKDVEDFRKRVLSFIEGQKWVFHPLILSPLICARYGWKCINSNLLECVTCGAKLCTQEPRIDIYDAYKACIQKILTDLRDGHKTDCPWPLAPSPESFIKVVALPKEEALRQFVSRLKPCLEFECSIPKVKDSVPSQLGLNEEHVLSLCKLAEIASEDSHCIGMSIVCMAATGWSLFSKKDDDLKTYLKCDCCQRTIWVKSFNLLNALSAEDDSISANGKNCDKESENLDDDLSVEKPRKRIKLEKTNFDPLVEHRPWCRWILTSQDKPRTLDNKNQEEVQQPKLGWQIFMKSLLRNSSSPHDSSFESTPSKEKLRSVQNLLESWTSPVS